MGKTFMMGLSGTHWLYKNGFRFSRGWFAALGNKWSYNVAFWAVRVWMAWDGAVGKP